MSGVGRSTADPRRRRWKEPCSCESARAAVFFDSHPGPWFDSDIYCRPGSSPYGQYSSRLNAGDGLLERRKDHEIDLATKDLRKLPKVPSRRLPKSLLDFATSVVVVALLVRNSA